MPAKMAVKKLRASWAQGRKYVLEIRGGARRGTERRRIERATSHRQHQHTREPAANLEATRAHVLVRHPVACEVKHWPENERGRSRPAGRAGRGACRNVERNNHCCRW